jgi:hypothetical protein
VTPPPHYESESKDRTKTQAGLFGFFDGFDSNLENALADQFYQGQRIARVQVDKAPRRKATGRLSSLSRGEPDNLGNAFAAAERHADAAAAAHEGLTTVRPFLERYPQDFVELTRALTQIYLKACEKSGTEPDQVLLGRVRVNGTAQ